jgi:hypothetical protein
MRCGAPHALLLPVPSFERFAVAVIRRVPGALFSVGPRVNRRAAGVDAKGLALLFLSERKMGSK